ncbi:phosphoribosylamine--glycine ligase [Streptomyces sp. NBC_00083]|uniref:phosphoribosylamine--glycine ligase n=1 Tax=Streptomyces sp. NBC_00083 TaxID=2975647 RepID=UPI00224D341F|nr:phosphoribosylamine--glycine ligase [Streptomyces sp. NBC_00083]MCX5388363.1 phosphoribosylamine--glycine ligase [Streptomyces sp. NBC_00083]
MTHILVVDGTGRGHAICDLFLRTDPDVTVYYGPGTDALDGHGRIVPVPGIRFDDPDTALAFLAEHPVEFVFVSNIDALSAGYADVLAAAGHQVIGPSAQAARLEASKERGKRFCEDHGLPTARYGAFTDPGAAKAYIRALPYACVVKTDGLTPDGDGAVVCDTAVEATAAVDAFAAAQGERFQVVVEERLYGREISVFALLDGEDYLLFPTALDFKRTLEGDAGKNCDGMGSIAPHPQASPALLEQLRRDLVEPLVAGLRDEGLAYTGFVYIGAMLTAAGLRVIEINTRFGDSEAEAVLPGVHSDFTELCRAVLRKDLGNSLLVTDALVRCSVALTQGCLDPADPGAAPGWPFGAFATGGQVLGLTQFPLDRTRLFYANLRAGAEGQPVTSGGRVLHVVGSGTTLAEARAQAYRRIGAISFPGMRHRADIGAALERSSEPAWSVLEAAPGQAPQPLAPAVAVVPTGR